MTGNSGEIGSLKLPPDIVTGKANDPKPTPEPSRVYISGFLAVKGDAELQPKVWPDEATWGKKVFIKGYAFASTHISSLKLDLASSAEMRSYANESATSLAQKMTLLLNVADATDDTHMSDVSCLGATTLDIFSNDVNISIEGKHPPTMDQTLHRQLMRTCEKPNLVLTDLDEKMEYSGHPGIHNAKRSRKGGCHGLPVLVLDGDEKRVRTALWTPPANRTAIKVKSEHYILTNRAAVFASQCHDNEITLKIRYEDDLVSPHQVLPKRIRLYQDTQVRSADHDVLTARNFCAGYTPDPP